MSGIFRVTRRAFLRDLGVGTGALVLGCAISPESLFASKLSKLTDLISDGIPLGPFIAIKPLSGDIIITAHRSEMGQGIRSSLAAVLADEFEADWSRVTVRQADADGPKYAIPNPDPNGTPKFLINEEGAQFADSSRSMAAYFMYMRLLGAGTRLVFVRAGALKFGVNASECEARQHKVWHKASGRSVDYGHLLLEAKKVAEVPPTVAEITASLKKPQDFRFIGTDKMPFVDARDMVTGKAVYGADVDLPGMLTAMIVRCPVANGEVKSFDATETLKVPGVVNVVLVRIPTLPAGGVGAGFLPHAGVAVVAKNTWAAWQGRRALKVEWFLGPNATYDSTAYRGELEASTNKQGKTLRSKGDVDAAFGVAAKVVERDYYVPHLAQTPMEPPAAVALYENGHWDIWSPTQGPELAQHYVGLAMLKPEDPLMWLLWQVTEPTEILKDCERQEQIEFNELIGKVQRKDLNELIKLRDELKKEIRDKVKVHVTLLGGGFGRKSKPDYAIEAAFLAREHPGVPIRVQWTREDDIHFSYFHAVSHQRLKAGLDGDGHITAWLHRSAFPSFFATLFAPAPSVPEAVRPLVAKARSSYHGGGEYPYAAAIERAQGLEDMPFDVKNLRVENCPAQNHIRVGWMRSVSNIFHAFSIGSFADELAIEAGRDSKDNLLDLIGKGRVLDLEAEGVTCFDNNGFPVLKPGGNPPALPPYPPDTRRLRGVVERVATESGWDEKVRKYKGMKGRGLGIAAHRSFLSYVAIVVDVSLNDRNELTINEMYGAIDCGVAVNLDRIKAQMEGGMLYGLSYALLGEITVKDGAVEQNNFDDYPVLRIYQTPKIQTFIQEPPPEVVKEYGGNVPPTGVGEPPTPAVAPAVANAIFAAGGPRIREIPFAIKKESDRGKKVVVL
jgi:isoquinoline 1-oxidoreductase beta subunit